MISVLEAGAITQFAPAKVNLALHVTGKRHDGYHLLDSLVVFAGVGDRLEIGPSPTLNLSVTGPRARGVPDDARNLVWKAATWLSRDKGAAIKLEKHLPHAGGIGGGSADAAAALRGLSKLWGLDVPNDGPNNVATLGADVPVCFHGKPARMSGIGEILQNVPKLPEVWVVLVNAGVEVPTGAVFSSMTSVENPPLPKPQWNDFDSLISWLEDTRNDMEPAACQHAPIIGNVLEHLRALSGCTLARMSGSGGTCFGIFRTETAAREAALAMPDTWWAQHAPVLR